MENVLGQSKAEEQVELPPGFRFHPTDEELITHYLSPKVIDNCFCSIAVGEVDLNKCEPWDLPWRAKMGEKQWYFFSVRDRKYPTGLRTNRATSAGYWKATGKDKEIYKMKALVGMKKTLVFYKGRAPKGEKTNWVMHEYRLEGKFSIYNLPKSAKDEWVICRVFHKMSSGKKSLFSGLVRLNSYESKTEATQLPPLKDSSPCNVNGIGNIRDSTTYVTCFSNGTENQPCSQLDMIDTFKNPISFQNTFYTSEFVQNIEDLQHHSSSGLIQDQPVLTMLLENQYLNAKQFPKSEYIQETRAGTDVNSIISNQYMNQRSTGAPVALCTTTIPIIDIDSFWNY